MFWAAADPAPIPLLLLIGFGSLLLAWWISQWRNRKANQADAALALRRQRWYRIGMAAAAFLGIAWETPNLFFRSPRLTVESLLVVGDSVTAGLNDGEDTWPKQLSRNVAVQVFDASQPGATLKSARKQVQLLNQKSGDVLLLEIGGNDLLEGLPLREFERDLEQLLIDCQNQGKAIVMFELPLPPLAMRYGSIQRRLANQYQVNLVPRRRLVQVLTLPGSTVDGIHLSKTGQTRLAALVQSLLTISTWQPQGTGSYRHLEPPKKSLESRE